MDNKPVLAFDTSAAGASISLLTGGQMRTRTLGQGKQAVALVPTIDALMKEARVSYSDLAAIVTTIGPGSFTGQRIGLAALHGLVLVHATPVKLLTSHEAMAWSVFARADAPATILTVLKAGKGEVSVQPFTQNSGRPVATAEIELLPETTVNWPFPHYGNHVQETDTNYLPDADTENLCRIAHLLADSTLSQALPLYIRPPDAAIPKTPAWLAS